MQWFKADLHIHTVLSPCGGLDMSPVNIIRQALEKELDIIAITDHNSTRHCRSAIEIGRKAGIGVIPGAELNTKEEIHCLALFENLEQADEFQLYIDANLTVIQNNAAIFGPQYLVDEQENILEEENRLLVAALQTGIEEVIAEVHRLGGLAVPAHINRPYNSLYSQLGYLSDDLKADALEVALQKANPTFLDEHPETGRFPLLHNSDAHSLGTIGSRQTEFLMKEATFDEIRKVIASRAKDRIKVR
jgi:3',5'-nucleoside bisphosphate phosphatase